MKLFDSYKTRFKASLEAKFRSEWANEFQVLESKNHEIKKELLREQNNIEIQRISFKSETLKLESQLASIKEEHESRKSIILSEQNSELQRMNSEHDSEVMIMKKQIASARSILSIEENEVAHLQSAIGSKKSELEAMRSNLRHQLLVIESKASPASVWTEAFTAGFSKAWDMMMPLMTDGMERSKKLIENSAIQETLKRMNGHNKKAH